MISGMIHKNMPIISKFFLILSGIFLFFIAIAHATTIFFGPPAYGLVGAGPEISRRAANGDWHPAAIIGAISLLLLLGAYCAFAGAKLLPRPPLPLLRVYLFSVTALLLGRGAIGIFLLGLLRLNGYHMETLYIAGMGGSLPFWVWSSSLCVLIGAIQLSGTSLSHDLY